MTYQIVLTIHLFCAIIFLGYVFTDVIVLSILKKSFSKDEFEKIKLAISKRAIKIFPLTLLTLVLTGGYMFSKYCNSQLGFFNTPLQQLLMLKLFFALLIVLGVVYSLSCKILKKTPNPMMKKFHNFVLIIGILIVILAKLMFAV